ncbi:L-ribulose-5-phosphate 3-epimerase [Blautia sp.]|uniref:L-ribulose-5-phosphate 3-epimerase n=1 Tax=Blautia sp. TaxID=1955243 RepID=UPI003FD7FD08
MMKKYEIGLYEKAMRNTLSWEEKLKCAKECGYDYLEICIDATEEKINRIFMDTAEKKQIMEAVLNTGLPIGSMSVSALTKYALGDPDEAIRRRAMEIAEKSIELAVDLGARTVMIPGYDIYFGESTVETKKYFLENVKKIAEIAEKEGILVGFETMENNFMNTTGKAVQYVNMVDSAYLKIYPDAGNITNAAVENRHDVCEDLSLGKGKLIALHLKETKPGIFREVPFLTGHVQFEKIIHTAWELGVRRYVTELWDVGKDTWKEDICFANRSMRKLLDCEA